MRRKTIIKENGNHLLVRVDSIENLGGKEINLVSYEIWTDREKFERDIPVEWVGNDMYIYYSNHATTNEQSMIELFEKTK